MRIKCIETGEIFNSCAEADRKYNCKPGSVNRAANPKQPQKMAAGYHWVYADKVVEYKVVCGNGQNEYTTVSKEKHK